MKTARGGSVGPPVDGAVDLLFRYASVGLVYWALSLVAFGVPLELARVPARVRWRAHLVACVATVAAWPLAAASDIRALGRDG